MTRYKSNWHYILRKRRTQLTVATSAFAILFIGGLACYIVYPGIVTNVWAVLEPAIGISTLIVAMLVWYGEAAQDCENELPKRLNISFLLEGKEIMRCENAYLAGEGDIRALGQQLGGQISGSMNTLAFKSFEQKPGEIRLDEYSGEEVKTYELKITLSDIPAEFIIGGKVKNAVQVNKFKKGQLVVRRYIPSQNDFKEEWH